MAILISTFQVMDFDRYWVFHQQQLELRRDHGCTGSRVLRGAKNAMHITVVMEFPSAQDAERYLAIALAESGVRRAGVTEAPRIEIYEEAGRTA